MALALADLRILNLTRYAPGPYCTMILAYFKQKFLIKTRDQWFDVLSRVDIPVGKVNTLGELADDPR